MAITRMSDTPNMLLAGSDAQFNKAAKKPRRQYWKEICSVRNQSKLVGNYDTIGNLSAAEKHVEGTTIVFDKIAESNRTYITSGVYDKAVAATLEAQEFDQYNVVAAQFGEPLVAALNTKKERVVADVYNGVFTATGADGVYLASDSHPLKNNTALLNDNLVTGALSNESLRAAKNMFNFTYNQAGDYFDTQPTHLLIHPNKMFQALELLNSTLTAWQLSNTKNVLQDVAPIKIISNPYLTYNVTTDVSPWFMLDMSLDGAGCILQVKKGLTLKTWFEEAELDSLKGVAYEMYGAGMVAPGYGFVASTGA